MVAFFQISKTSSFLFKGLVLSFLFCCSFIISVYSQGRISKPIVWDYDELVLLKTDSLTSLTVQQYIYAANKICKKNPVTITQKSKTFAPNNHYYCSIGSYWWPDSLNTGKYINNDGKTNPESLEYDITTLKKLTSQCRILSIAFFFTNDQKYYNAFVKQLRSFFINKDTRMFPTFEYAQVIPGQNNNKGRSTGMIDSYSFNTVIESIRLVDGVKRIDNRTMRCLKKWFYRFSEDSEKRYGNTLRKANNNISLAYDVTLVNMYLFSGNEHKAKQIANNFAKSRLFVQILEDGRQPAELKRSKAFTYSLFNLTHIIDFCCLARYWYPFYYDDHFERIDAAFSFLGQYANDESSFPYQQISSWEQCRNTLQLLEQRRVILRKNVTTK